MILLNRVISGMIMILACDHEVWSVTGVVMLQDSKLIAQRLEIFFDCDGTFLVGSWSGVTVGSFSRWRSLLSLSPH